MAAPSECQKSPKLSKWIFGGLGYCFYLKCCCAIHFDLLRNPVSTVPMYADESGLLVFGASLTSASLLKNKFFDRLRALPHGSALFASSNSGLSILGL